MRKSVHRYIAIGTSALVLCLSFGWIVWAQGSYTVPWWTLNSGGESQGGTFHMAGVVGQASSGEPLSGGTFQLTGGFWALDTTAPTATAVPLTPIPTATAAPTSTPVSSTTQTVFLPAIQR